MDGYLSGYQKEVAGGQLCALLLGVWYIFTFVLQRAWDLGSEDPSSSSGSLFYYLAKLIFCSLPWPLYVSYGNNSVRRVETVGRQDRPIAELISEMEKPEQRAKFLALTSGVGGS